MQISFDGYKSPLKTLWRKGKLKGVTRGLYGDILTKENLSLDHLLPISKGGKTVMSNLALASKAQNEARGNKDLKEVLSQKQAIAYIKQFAGNREMHPYINDFLRTLEKLGVIR